MKRAVAPSDSVADVNEHLKKCPQCDLRFPALLKEIGVET
jgi:hypothetical protein